MDSANNTEQEASKDTLGKIIEMQINSIKWSDYETAYGNADPKIPTALKMILSDNQEAAKKAVNELWASLCHQHAYISSAALPSYGILKTALMNVNSDLKVEILDIINGFAHCSIYSVLEHEGWELDLRVLLLKDVDIYRNLRKDPDDDIAYFADSIFDNLTKGVIKQIRTGIAGNLLKRNMPIKDIMTDTGVSRQDIKDIMEWHIFESHFNSYVATVDEQTDC